MYFIHGLIVIAALSAQYIYAAEESSFAYSQYRNGNLTDAARAYMKEAYASPDDPDPLLNAAVIFEEIGMVKEAVLTMEKAASIKNGDADIFSELGWMKFHAGDFAGAREAFLQALAINHSHERAMLGTGLVYAKLGERNIALEMLERYQKLKPFFAGMDYLMGETYFNFGMYYDAVDRFKQAIKKDFTFEEAEKPLARALKKQRETKQTSSEYSKSREGAEASGKTDAGAPVEGEKHEEPFPAQNIEKSSSASDFSRLRQGFVIRVGIGTYGKGVQPYNKSVSFQATTPFLLIGKKTGRLYERGGAKQKWTAKFRAGRVEIYNADGVMLGKFKDEVIIKPERDTGTVIINDIRYGRGYPWSDISDMEYRGRILLAPSARGIRIVNELRTEEYLLSVVPSEVIASWPEDALKAQAVIARTQVLIRRLKGGLHKKQGYHLCDSQHCQAYRGVRSESPATQRAVIVTQGEVLTYRGRPAYTFYYSNCGGHIQSSGEVEGWGKVVYLQGKPDAPENGFMRQDSPWKFRLWITSDPPAYCNYSGVVPYTEFRWLRIVPYEEISAKLNRKLGIGRLKAIIPLNRSLSGNVNAIMFWGAKKKVIVKKEHMIRYLTGLGQIRSTLFNIYPHRNSQGKTESYWIHGGGWGHGIGLCQSGAAGMAGKEGKNYKEILQFYYPGTSLRKVKYK